MTKYHYFIVLLFVALIMVPQINAQEEDTNPPVFKGVLVIDTMPEIAYLSLIWINASDKSLPITYNIYVSEESGKQNFSKPNFQTNNTQIEVGPLKPSTEYYIVVRAEDSFGNEDNNTEEKRNDIQCKSFSSPTKEFKK